MEPSWRRDVIEAVDPDQRLAAELEARCYSAAEVQDLEDRQRTFDDARKMPAIPDKEILLSLALRVAREIGSACAPVPVTVGMRSAFTACVVGMSCPTLLVRQTIEWWRCSKPSVDWVSASGTSSGSSTGKCFRPSKSCPAPLWEISRAALNSPAVEQMIDNAPQMRAAAEESGRRERPPVFRELMR